MGPSYRSKIRYALGQATRGREEREVSETGPTGNGSETRRKVRQSISRAFRRGTKGNECDQRWLGSDCGPRRSGHVGEEGGGKDEGNDDDSGEEDDEDGIASMLFDWRPDHDEGGRLIVGEGFVYKVGRGPDRARAQRGTQTT